MSLRLLSAVVVACSVLASIGNAQDSKPSQVDLNFFESRIRPLLLAKCGKCHGAEKQEGSLRLDSLAGILQGGEIGPALIPKQADKSLLLAAVSHRNPDLKMPPNGKLSDVEIADLKRWIELGAPHPDMLKAGTTIAPRKGKIDYDEARKFWSFRPVVRSAAPAVKNAAWPRTDIDRFVLAKLEAQQLEPAKAADKRTLIRRATLDLIGLPPTPEEVELFLADESPEAFQKVVDRLLESPHYGERWGRHWLDVARYADSNGLDENTAFGNAWRYRDWVVSALNRDVPFNEFVTAQVAGDLLPFDDSTPAGRERRNEQLIATSFLAIGPKVLAEVDATKMEMDIIDEQLETLGRAFLGLTIGCARCHDHKFDPITAADYYGLAGIFKSTKTMENFIKLARWYENPIPTDRDLAAKREHDVRVAAQKQRIEDAVASGKQKLLEGQPADTKLPTDFEKQFSDDLKKQLVTERAELKKLEAASAELIPTSMGATDGKVADVAVHLRGSHLTLGEIVPRRTPELFTSLEKPAIGAAQSGRLELAQWLTNPRHPLTARVLVNRVWRWHFGQGLSKSPDNFGRLGEAPSHPELLDWLADEFVREGWSLKKLHRLMLSSAVYQQASDRSPASLTVDPDNRLLSHFELRRMDAEVMRDSLLAVSGLLDRTMGGSLLHVKNRDYFFDHTSIDMTKYDSLKRTLYLPVVRNHLYDVFVLFDATDATVPNGDRSSSTVAPQALFLMNSDLIHDAAAALAKALLSQPPENAPENDPQSDEQRLARLYSLAYARPATSAELAKMQGFVEQLIRRNAENSDAAAKKLAAWQSLSHVVLSSNEFLYVR